VTLGSPFAIDGPAMISFSGGRTSAFMLRQCLDEGLQRDVHVLFSNTGKERPETLNFIHDVATRWKVPVHWLEYDAGSGYREVSYETASRDGAPFATLIRKRSFLPNPVTRFCTQELKIRVMAKWMRARGYEAWTNVVGIRADEPRRIAKMRVPTRESSATTRSSPRGGSSKKSVAAASATTSLDTRGWSRASRHNLCCPLRRHRASAQRTTTSATASVTTEAS